MSDPQFGQLLALLSASSFAFGTVFVAKGAKGGGDRGVLFSILVTLVFSSILWHLLESSEIGYSGDKVWRGIVWFSLAGIFAMVFGRTLIYASIRELGVTRASSVKRLNPFFSVLLAFIFVGEVVSGWDGIGMILIAGGFGLHIHDSKKAVLLNENEDRPPPIKYLYGVGSALAYSFSYIARKYGLEATDAPAFGTMISAISGFTFFIVAAIFTDTYRNYMRNIFSNLNIWLVLAAIFVSSGQILQFAALNYETISTVVMITSLEIYLASFLSIVVFRTERRPGISTFIAASLATAGAVAVAFG